ncbi:MAG: hypothetical protein WA051_01240 [Minisyncoccia bacterium]
MDTVPIIHKTAVNALRGFVELRLASSKFGTLPTHVGANLSDSISVATIPSAGSVRNYRGAVMSPITLPYKDKAPEFLHCRCHCNNSMKVSVADYMEFLK